MSLHNKLLHLFPDAKEGDWVLQKPKGQPVFIEKWNRPESQPTQAVIDAVTPDQQNNAEETRDLTSNFNLSRKDKVLIKWIASRTGGGTPGSILAELRTIWRNT